MIKTVSVNLGGIIFQVNEDAYSVLTTYINTLKMHYGDTEQGNEIIADIEARFADVFLKRFKAEDRNVVNILDAEDVIRDMGQPRNIDKTQFEEEQTEEEVSTADDYIEKRLYRDSDNAVIGGVCAGLSAFEGLKDPLWMRLVFILMVLLGGSGILLYLILWAIVPPAKTASQKLQMRGKQINIDNVEETIKRNEEENEASSRGSTIEHIINEIGKLFGFLFGFVQGIFKILAKAMSGFIVFFLIVSIFALLGVVLYFIPKAIIHIFDAPIVALIAASGIFISLGIPLLYLIYKLSNVFSNFRVQSKRLKYGTFGIWILGLIMSTFSLMTGAKHYAVTDTVYSEDEFIMTSDSLVLSLNEGFYYNFNKFESGLEVYPSERVKLNIASASSKDLLLSKEISATGKNQEVAAFNAQQVNYQYEVKGNEIILDNYFDLGEKKKWRDQTVELTLFIPVGTHFKMDREVKSIINSIESNGIFTERFFLRGNEWKMTPKGMIALDSIFSDETNDKMLRADFKDFDELTIKGALNIEISEGDEFSILIDKGSGNYKDVNIDQIGDRLSITSNGGSILKSSRETPSIYIEMPELEDLNLYGTFNCNIIGFSNDDMDISVYGDSKLSASNLFVTRLRVNLVGTSSFYASGFCETLKLEMNGASNFQGLDLEGMDTEVRIKGQSIARFNTIDRIRGRAEGSSIVYYRNDPEIDVKLSDVAEYRKLD